MPISAQKESSFLFETVAERIEAGSKIEEREGGSITLPLFSVNTFMS